MVWPIMGENWRNLRFRGQPSQRVAVTRSSDAEAKRESSLWKSFSRTRIHELVCTSTNRKIGATNHSHGAAAARHRANTTKLAPAIQNVLFLIRSKVSETGAVQSMKPHSQ